ncbi:leucine-rich repeat-containing protein 15, partial [Musca vetustissima]|uniref:leucine-rich repeat-containing protein 15 n=1 Tax=Musca vetustissima TaxID=27455 RepID=UPI002AB7860C
MDPIGACPAEVCICKWKGGKQTVECGGQSLPNIPEGMDPGTQVLNFSGNALQVLQSERFLRMDLLNLQKIYLSRNQLIRIHEKAFRGLTNLVELDLSENSLQHIPTETFQDYSSLMRLSLSGNPIRELKTSAFRYLSFLTTLELSNCQIERIENEAFVGMDNLEWLRLDGNRISYIQGNHILPKSLHGISLQSNRWTCDCRLLDLHNWLNSYNTPQTEEPKCVEPLRLKGQVIKSLKKEEFACLPEVTPQSTYTEVSEGRNLTISCVVRAIPEPKVLWLFNGQVMSNDSFIDNMHMLYYIDETST